MNVSFNLKLTCSSCHAVVELSGSETKSDPYVLKQLGRPRESAKPKIPWRRDGTIIKKLNAARKFVRVNSIVERSRNGVTDWYNWTPQLPEYVSVTVGKFGALVGSTYVSLVEFRFIDCPACGGRAYLGSREKNADTSI